MVVTAAGVVAGAWDDGGAWGWSWWRGAVVAMEGWG